MKIKDILCRVKNSKNNQINYSLKKKKLKEMNISEIDILNIKLDKKLKGCFE